MPGGTDDPPGFSSEVPHRQGESSMAFDVGNAARFNRTVVLKFNNEKLKVTYNAGEKFRAYQDRAQKHEQERVDLQYQIQRFGAGENEEDRAKTDAAYEKLIGRLNHTRRAIADNICGVIEDWDLEGDRDAIRELLPKAERKGSHPDATGHGKIPIDGAWLDALPLPDDFILKIVETVNENFNSGGATGNA